jgi:phenylalanyl-tRNA synthetase beta chain
MARRRLVTISKKAVVSQLVVVDGVILWYIIDPAFFPGRAATIYYRATSQEKDLQIGTLGILHPSVLAKFEIGYPCSALEFTLDPFKKQMPKFWTNDE